MRFVNGEPALILNRDTLVIGDVHVGYSEKNEVSRRLNLEEVMLEKLKELHERFHLSNLIILGDLKDEILSVPPKVYLFVRELQEIFSRVILVKGNHDAGMEVVKGVEVVPSSGMIFREGNRRIGLIHGHSWPKEEMFNCDYLITAHQHTHIKMYDKLGKMYMKKVWVIAPVSVDSIKERVSSFNPNLKIIILPAFHPLIYGVELGKGWKGIGPVLSNELFNIKDGEVYSLEGVYLGRVSRLVSHM